jgi:hypothetical protein
MASTIEQWGLGVMLVFWVAFVFVGLATEFVPLLIGRKPIVLLSWRTKFILLQVIPLVTLALFAACEIIKRL